MLSHLPQICARDLLSRYCAVVPEEKLAVSKMQNVRCVSHRGVDIVRYHDDARVIAEIDKLYEVIHLVCRNGVKACHRLIEKQQFLRCAHCARKQNALLLSSGKLKIAAVGYIIDAEPLHILGRGSFVGSVIEQPAVHGIEPAREHHLAHGRRKIALDLCLLRKIADLGRLKIIERYRAGRRRFQPQQAAHERALTRAGFRRRCTDMRLRRAKSLCH